MSRDFSLTAWGTEGPVKVDLYDDQGNLHQKSEFPQVDRDDSALPSGEKEITVDDQNTIDDSDNNDDNNDPDGGDDTQDDADDSQDDDNDDQTDGDDDQDDSDDGNDAAVEALV